MLTSLQRGGTANENGCLPNLSPKLHGYNHRAMKAGDEPDMFLQESRAFIHIHEDSYPLLACRIVNQRNRLTCPTMGQGKRASASCACRDQVQRFHSTILKEPTQQGHLRVRRLIIKGWKDGLQEAVTITWILWGLPGEPLKNPQILSTRENQHLYFQSSNHHSTLFIFYLELNTVWDFIISPI